MVKFVSGKQHRGGGGGERHLFTFSLDKRYGRGGGDATRLGGRGGDATRLGGDTHHGEIRFQASSTEVGGGKTPPVHILIGQKIWEGGGRHASEGGGTPRAGGGPQC
jgi:hypothetical protein